MNLLKGLNPEKVAFYALATITLIVILTGSYLPMVDLPQHAAQVATLDNILKDKSVWANQVELNFRTPYLTVYFIWLLIYQVFDIVTSSRILISVIFITYLSAFWQVKRAFGASNLVIWVAVPSFFGFCFQWGFVTFLFAVALGLFFLLANIKWVHSAASRFLPLSAAIAVLGTLLFFSHVLAFAFFCFLSFAYIIAAVKKPLVILKDYFPIYIYFSLLLLTYFMQQDPLAGAYSYGANIIQHGLKEKLVNLLSFPWTMLAGDYRYLAISIILLVLPFFLSLRPSTRIEKYTPILCFIVLWIILPHFLNNTFFIYERFSLLFFSLYYLIFEKRPSDSVILFHHKAAYGFFAIIIGYLIAQNFMTISLAKKDSQDFSAVLQKAPPGKRALTLVFAPTSPSIGIPFTYVHFGAWYQAQKDGWTDFSFAWFHPQIVRFKPDRVPEVSPGFEWNPMQVQHLNSCRSYDLIFVRSYNLAGENSIRHSRCSNYRLISQQGAWFLYANPNILKEK